VGEYLLPLVAVSGGRGGAVLVLLVLSAEIFLLGCDGVRVDPHEVWHVTEHVDLILNVHAGFLLVS